MTNRFLLIAAGLLVLAPTSYAQRPALPLQPSQIIRAPNGDTIEVVGLRRWTVAMIQDSLDRYSPGDSLQKHSCAAVLRYSLHFADAAAVTIPITGTTNRIVVTVREPQDSALVRYRIVGLDTTNGRRDWAEFAQLLAKNPRVTWQLPMAFLAPPVATRTSAPVDTVMASALAFVRAHATDRDRREAQRVLQSSLNYRDRTTAALVLMNFVDRDDVLRALVEAMRQSDGTPKSVAAAVVRSALTVAPRRVEWGTATSAIHSMLDGTSLFQFTEVTEILRKSRVGPADARTFLRGGSEILLAYLASPTQMYSNQSHELLVQLRGKDLGADPEPWRQWIASL